MKNKFLINIVVCCLLLLSCAESSRETSDLSETFLVRWFNYDGQLLEEDTSVPLGAFPSYDGAKPIRESDIYEYTFSGWDPVLTSVTQNVDYTATYEAAPILILPKPSHQSGFYDEPFDLSFAHTDFFDVYYTLNYEEPTLESTKYEQPIPINDKSLEENYYSIKENISALDVYYPSHLVDKCTTIRAIYVRRDSQEIVEKKTFTYFVNYDEKEGYDTLPIISLGTEEKNLFDYESGIYVTGKTYDENPHEGSIAETFPANYWQKGREWERVSHLTFFNEKKDLEFEQEIGIRIHGGWSRSFAQKSFNLYARKEYDGNSKIQKKFFNGIKPHSLMLRAGGYRDTFCTKVRDALAHDLSKDELFDVQLSRPCILFLNGEYWGIYNLQERYSNNYVEEHHEVDKDNVLIISKGELDEGKEEDFHLYTEWLDFFDASTFSRPEDYQKALAYIDPEEFAQYMSTELYIGNIDWPVNNQRSWREVNSANAQWHFMMYDTDDSMGMVPDMCNYDKDPFLSSNHWSGGPLEPSCLMGLILSKLIEDSSFRNLFRETFSRIGRENFATAKVNKYLREKEQIMKTPMAKQYRRFVSEEYEEDYFHEQIDVIREFFNHRYSHAMEFLNEHIPE